MFSLKGFHAYGQTSLWKADTEIQYWSDLALYTTPERHTGLDYMGWLINSSSLSYKKTHSLHLGLMLTHGGEPSLKSVGDLQTFSNIEAGWLYGFYETYYQYNNDHLQLKIGQQDINTDFLVSENALLFAHSSAGIDPVTTLNMPAPTYPFTAIALTSRWTIKKALSIRTGIFDGQFGAARKNFITIDWKISGDKGLLYIVEPEIHLLHDRVILKPGTYYHSGNFISKKDNSIRRGLWGYYLVSDITLFQKEEKSIGLFTQYSISRPELSDLQYYAGTGLRIVQPFKWDRAHELGIFIGYTRLFSQWSETAEKYDIISETAIELSGQLSITPWLKLQPYFQLILRNDIHPEKPEPLIAALRAITTL